MLTIHKRICISIHLMLLFINVIPFQKINEIHFNTSHVTVYLLLYSDRAVSISDFNTSHVTVYPQTHRGSSYQDLISIHLMLLFILIQLPCNAWFFQFQYISCYCLSATYWKTYKKRLHFNTSHVTVYLSDSLCIWYDTAISIHLMLLFISIRFKEHFIDFHISIHLMLLFILIPA